MAGGPIHTVEEFLQVRNISLKSAGGQQVIAENCDAVSDIVLLSINTLVLTVEAVSLPPVTGPGGGLLHEVGHGFHELESTGSSVVLIARPCDSTEQLNGTAGISGVDVGIA